MCEKRRHILWLCNTVLPDFAEEFGIKENPYGGWMSGMLHELEKENDIEIAFVFPIRDEARMRDGICQGHPYFSFHNDATTPYEVKPEHTERFREILREYKPDVIHLWGTEYAWALEMTRACEAEELLHRVLVHIQGLISIYARHYTSGVSEPYRKLRSHGQPTILEEQESFRKRGENEIEVLKKVRHVAGRTDWDHACCLAINPKLEYHWCPEILRDAFYQNASTWSVASCELHRIFVSQASYPIKGFHYLIFALPLILQSYPDTRVIVAGRDLLHASEPTPYAKYLADEMERLGCADAVQFLGTQSASDMMIQYQKAHVFVSASTIENSSNSICEAMLIGTPVVASFVGGTPDLIRHGETGFLYPETEAKLLAYYVLRCFSEMELCERLSQNATLTINEFLSREEAGHVLRQTYESLWEENR